MLNIDKRKQMKKIAMKMFTANIILKMAALGRSGPIVAIARTVAIQRINEACSIPASVYCTDKPEIDKGRYKRHMRKNRIPSTQCYLITGKV